MKRFTAAFTLLALMASTGMAAVGGKNAQYVGGTVTGLKEGAEGRIDTANRATGSKAFGSRPLAIAT